MIQAEEKVGGGGGGHLQLRDAEVMFPHETTVVWQEGDGEGWHEVPDLKLEPVTVMAFTAPTAPVPAAASGGAGQSAVMARAAEVGLLPPLAAAKSDDEATVKKALEVYDEMGATCVGDIVECDMVDQFCKDLGLKPIPAKKLAAALNALK